MHDHIFHRLIETMNDGFGILDDNGFITFANERICQMIGSKREDLVGHHVTDFIHENDLQTFQERFEENRKGIVTSFELTCKRTDGEKIFTIISPGSIFDEHGNFSGGFAVITDITERKKTEDALRESEERFRTIFDRAFDGILLADPEEKKLVTGNQAICEMLGYSAEELTALTVYDIHPQKHIAAVLDQFERMDRGDLTIAHDIPLKNRHGSVFYMDISSSSLIIGGQRLLMGIFRDTTKRKQSDEQRRLWNEQLENLVLERTKQLEAVVAELESEILERRQAEDFLLRRRADAQELYDEIVQALIKLQMSLKNMVYVPTEDVIFKLGDMHVLVGEILEKFQKGNVMPPPMKG